MRLLFVTRGPYYPESSGGAQQSSLLLFDRLRSRGWEIEVLSGIDPRSLRWWSHARRRVSRLRLPEYSPCDEDLGYRCWRRPICPPLPVLKRIEPGLWGAWFVRRLRSFRPDIVMSEEAATDSLFKQAIRLGFPCLKMIRSLPLVKVPTIIPPELHWMGNSPYAASIARDVSGKEAPFVLPLIDAGKYRAESRTPRTITFINPTEQKGVDIAIEAARLLPDHPFLFVKGKWSGFRPGRIERIVAPARALPNVEVWEHQSDMRKVYAETRVLLVPSQFVETFGRVIVEAHLNGIPVVAAHVGGVPYTLGKGGILVEPRNDPRAYAAALRELMEDKDRYEMYAQLAHRNSARPEFEADAQVDVFEAYVRDVVLGKGRREPAEQAVRCVAGEP